MAGVVTGGEAVKAIQAQGREVNGIAEVSNMAALGRSRTLVSIACACLAGWLGLTGLSGFVLYLFAVLLSSFLLLVRLGFKAERYFQLGNRVAVEGLGHGLMSFVLFWTLSYDIVHIFSHHQAPVLLSS